MAKLLVETKGDIQVVGTGEEHHAKHYRPSVVRKTKFIATHIADGNLVMVAELSDNASDKEFAELWAAETSKEGVKPEDVAAISDALKADYAKSYAVGAEPKKAPPKTEEPKK